MHFFLPLLCRNKFRWFKQNAVLTCMQLITIVLHVFARSYQSSKHNRYMLEVTCLYQTLFWKFSIDLGWKFYLRRNHAQNIGASLNQLYFSTQSLWRHSAHLKHCQNCVVSNAALGVEGAEWVWTSLCHKRRGLFLGQHYWNCLLSSPAALDIVPVPVREMSPSRQGCASQLHSSLPPFILYVLQIGKSYDNKQKYPQWREKGKLLFIWSGGLD